MYSHLLSKKELWFCKKKKAPKGIGNINYYEQQWHGGLYFRVALGKNRIATEPNIIPQFLVRTMAALIGLSSGCVPVARNLCIRLDDQQNSAYVFPRPPHLFFLPPIPTPSY